MSETKWTEGEWVAARMVHAETGDPLSPEELGEYLTNSVRMREECTTFLFVRVGKEDGEADVCLVGNGPDGPYNARLIATAPKLYEALDNLVALHVREMEGLQFSQPGPEEWIEAVETAASAMAEARGEL